MTALRRFDGSDSAAPAVLGTARETWPDVAHGIAIIAVVAIHSTGHVLPRLSERDWGWYAMASVNRALQFAVPAFLMVSTYLNARSLGREPSAAGSAKLIARRLRSIGIPYLLASAYAVIQASHRTATQIDAVHFLKLLLLGRCAYHLYFVILVMQLYVVLPFAVRLFARPRPLRLVVAWAAALQIGMFGVNRILFTLPELHLVRERWPGLGIESSILWYIPSIALGLWLSSAPRPVAAVAVSRPVLLASAGAMSIYLALSVPALFLPVDTAACQAAEWVYTAAASLLLLGVAARWSNVLPLAALGRCSLTVYLAHPFIIEAVDSLYPGMTTLSPWIAAPLYAFAAIACCVGISRMVAAAAAIRFGPSVSRAESVRRIRNASPFEPKAASTRFMSRPGAAVNQAHRRNS